MTRLPRQIGDEIGLRDLQVAGAWFRAVDGRNFAMLPSRRTGTEQDLLFLVEGGRSIVIDQNEPDFGFDRLVENAAEVASRVATARSEATSILKEAGFVPRFMSGMSVQWVWPRGADDPGDAVLEIGGAKLDCTGDPAARTWSIMRHEGDGSVCVDGLDLREAIENARLVPAPDNSSTFPDNTVVVGIQGLRSLIMERTPVASMTMN